MYKRQAINCATFVGYKVGGVSGSVIATLGVVIPSFVIIIVVSILFNMFKNNIIVNNVFAGVKAGVIAVSYTHLDVYKRQR